MPLWQIDIYPADDQVDREAMRTAEEIAELGLGQNVSVAFAKSFLVQGEFARDEAIRLADMLLCDSVTERSVVAIAGQDILNEPPGEQTTLVNVLPKPGVMDPVAASTVGAARMRGSMSKPFERCASIGWATSTNRRSNRFAAVRFPTMRSSKSSSDRWRWTSWTWVRRTTSSWSRCRFAISMTRVCSGFRAKASSI